jgi:hypothetical protein
MTATVTATSVDEPMRRIEQLVGEFERQADPAVRERARLLVGAILAVHQAGLRRVLELIEPLTTEQLFHDELVGSLLLLHELHPAIETPARRAAVQLEAPAEADSTFVPLTQLRVHRP